jgi:hypothetical protein
VLAAGSSAHIHQTVDLSPAACCHRRDEVVEVACISDYRFDIVNDNLAHRRLGRKTSFI